MLFVDVDRWVKSSGTKLQTSKWNLITYIDGIVSIQKVNQVFYNFEGICLLEIMLECVKPFLWEANVDICQNSAHIFFWVVLCAFLAPWTLCKWNCVMHIYHMIRTQKHFPNSFSLLKKSIRVPCKQDLQRIQRILESCTFIYAGFFSQSRPQLLKFKNSCRVDNLIFFQNEWSRLKNGFEVLSGENDQNFSMGPNLN